MNVSLIFTTPWRVARSSASWRIWLFFFAGCVVVVPLGFSSHGTHWQLPFLGIYCLAAFFFWAFHLSSLLLVAIDARQLRIPGISQTVVRSLICYGVLVVAAPLLVLVPFGVNALVVVVCVTVAVLAGLAFVLLPRYISMFIGFLPVLWPNLDHLIHIPSPVDLRFISWAVGAMLVFLLIDVLRWRQLLHAESKTELGLRSAMVMYFRNQGATGYWGGLSRQSSSQRLRQLPDWLRVRADLSKVGPRTPVLALCTALGGWYVPQTWASVVRQLLPRVLLPLLLILLMVLLQFDDPRSLHGSGLHHAWLDAGIGIIGWFGLSGGAMLTALSALVLEQRWSRTNAELPLLALLPGLGDARAVRRHLLLAALGKPVLAQTLLLMVVVGAARMMHVGTQAVMFVTVAQLGCAGVLVALALSIFGGRRLPGWGRMVLLISVSALVLFSAMIPLITLGSHPWQPGVGLQSVLVAGWLVLAVVLLWLGRRGWQGLQRRPHPFLAN